MKLGSVGLAVDLGPEGGVKVRGYRYVREQPDVVLVVARAEAT